MSWKQNLRKGRSHLIFCVVLIVAGAIVVQMEDKALTRETGNHPTISLRGTAKTATPCPVSPQDRP